MALYTKLGLSILMILLACVTVAQAETVVVDFLGTYFNPLHFDDPLHVAYEHVGSSFIYESSVNALTGVPDHIALSINMHQGWNESSPNRFNGTVKLTDGAVHTVSAETYPMELPYVGNLLGFISTTVYITMDGVTTSYNFPGDMATIYINLALNESGAWIFITEEPIPGQARRPQDTAVLSSVGEGAIIYSYEITANAEEHFFVHKQSMVDVQEAVEDTPTRTGGLWGNENNSNIIMWVDTLISFATGAYGSIVKIIGVVGYFIFDSLKLATLLVAFEVLDVAYRLDRNRKNILRAIGQVFNDNVKLFMFILDVIQGVISFFSYIIQSLRALWPL